MNYYYSYEEYKDRVYPIYFLTVLILTAILIVSFMLKNKLYEAISAFLLLSIGIFYFYTYIVSRRTRIYIDYNNNKKIFFIDKYPTTGECLLRMNLKKSIQFEKIDKLKATNSFIYIKGYGCIYHKDKFKEKPISIILLRTYNHTNSLINDLKNIK